MTTTDALDPNIARSTNTIVGGIQSAVVPGRKPADGELGKDAFLKLLVAQMKYQDPMSPADGTDFIAQTAQFTLVEKMAAMSDQNEKMLASQNNATAAGMVGRTVAWDATDDDGKTITKSGVVAGIKLTKDGPLLRVGEEDVALDKVTAVKPTEDVDANALILAGQNAATAAGLMGRYVTYETKDAAGSVTTKSGLVGGVKFTANGPMLRVGDDDVSMAAITAISPTAPPVDTTDGDTDTGTDADTTTTDPTN
jgi:flagellar basal-body rod modification protein FlgD